jgi:capsular polysaccharide export protein
MGRFCCIGFRRWKSCQFAPFLSFNKENLIFVSRVAKAAKLNLNSSDKIVAWGNKISSGIQSLSETTGAQIVRLEDGFIRSVGLGSDLIRPLSLVFDQRGIYFDSSKPSDLEKILQETIFTPDEILQAQRVRALIVENQITKYNMEPRGEPRWDTKGRKVVLVPGQVEDDASIKFGSSLLQTNRELLSLVRQRYPEAFIVYKPHPDVMSGNRSGKLAASNAIMEADYIETQWSIVSCINASDVICTMSSLSGFDALLRGKDVVVYGQPFYAGWGLTSDLNASAECFKRRTRALSLDELVAGSLIKYPLYWDWDLKGYTTCEATILGIIESRDKLEKKGQLNKLREGYIKRQFRKIKIILQSYLKNNEHK